VNGHEFGLKLSAEDLREPIEASRELADPFRQQIRGLSSVAPVSADATLDIERQQP
jgi:hypothetical protein